MKEQTRHFILIDDSRMDLFILEKLLHHADPHCTIQKFERPDKALEFMTTHTPPHTYTVLLDINMPVITGFEYLDRFAELPESIRQHYRFFIVTSSHNETDIQRGKSNPFVLEVLHKPLNKDSLLTLLNHEA